MSILELPLELYRMVLEYLPPTYVWKLRMVCRQWLEQSSSDLVADTALKAYGIKDMDDREELLQMLENHRNGRAIRQKRKRINGRLHDDKIQLCNDRAAVMLRSDLPSKTRVLVWDLVSKGVTRYDFNQAAICCFLTDSMVGVVGREHISWENFDTHQQQSVDRGRLGPGHVTVKAYKTMLASMVIKNVFVESLFTYDTITGVQRSQKIDLGKEDYLLGRFGFVFDANYFTIFYNSWHDLYGYHINVARYSEDGLVYSLPAPGIMRPVKDVWSVGANLYQITSSDRDPSVLLADMRNRLVWQEQRDLTMVWEDYCYVSTTGKIYSYTKARRRSSLVGPGDFIAGAVNYRWLVLLEKSEYGKYIQIMDFKGVAAGETVGGTNGWLWYKMEE